jgi:hypothetical protein
VNQKTRVVIESPYGTRPDGERCKAAEVARNERYLDRCIRDSLDRGDEAPYASHGFFTKAGRLDDTNPAQRRQGIEAGLAWAAAADLVVIYADHGVSEGMTQGIARHDENGIEIEYRHIGAELESE